MCLLVLAMFCGVLVPYDQMTAFWRKYYPLDHTGLYADPLQATGVSPKEHSSQAFS